MQPDLGKHTDIRSHRGGGKKERKTNQRPLGEKIAASRRIETTSYRITTFT